MWWVEVSCAPCDEGRLVVGGRGKKFNVKYVDSRVAGCGWARIEVERRSCLRWRVGIFGNGIALQIQEMGVDSKIAERDNKSKCLSTML